jgi:hypothetical protein
MFNALKLGFQPSGKQLNPKAKAKAKSNLEIFISPLPLPLLGPRRNKFGFSRILFNDQSVNNRFNSSLILIVSRETIMLDSQIKIKVARVLPSSKNEALIYLCLYP